MSKSSEFANDLTTPPGFTFDDMLNFAGEAWSGLGINAVRKWAVYNEQYFGGMLRPIPIVITNTLPFGRRLAFCSHGLGRTITINVPREHNRLLGDNCSLLHEMIHQCLLERGEYASHDGAGWRREIMRLHKEITGSEIWAGRSKTARQAGKVVRINEPHRDGRASLTQDEIACWPRSVNIRLGPLGG
jgi:hypothetical protein